MSRSCRSVVLFLVFVGIAMTMNQSAHASGNAKNGKKIAEKFCAVCHETAAGASRPHENRPASFQEIADTPGMGELALKVFFQTPHKQMPNLSITGQVRDDLITYITGLKRN